MPLPSNTTISISQIRTELGTSNGSLRALSALAGKSTPDAMSEFWGYSALTYSYVGFYYYENPCSGGTAVYYGSNGRWYRSGDGLNFTDITDGFGTTFAFYDPPSYLYYLYNFQVNNPIPLYFGDVYSNCQV